MPRIRYLKPEFFTDENIAELPMEARLLFQGLWCLADKAGRLEDRPKYIKVMLFPYDSIDIDKTLALLDGQEKRFIQRYQVDGKAFIQITHFDRHQKPHHTEKASEIPAPPIQTENNGSLTVKTPCLDGEKPDLMGKGMGKGMGSGECASAPHPAKFPKPSLPEVQGYIADKGYSVDPQKFIAHYEANGWKVGQNPMRNWKASVDYWQRSEHSTGGAKRAVGGAAPKDGKYAKLG